eukprot:jgi/Hompol1/5224/HPOL_004241-RA
MIARERDRERDRDAERFGPRTRFNSAGRAASPEPFIRRRRKIHPDPDVRFRPALSQTALGYDPKNMIAIHPAAESAETAIAPTDPPQQQIQESTSKLADHPPDLPPLLAMRACQLMSPIPNAVRTNIDDAFESGSQQFGLFATHTIAAQSFVCEVRDPSSGRRVAFVVDARDISSGDGRFARALEALNAHPSSESKERDLAKIFDALGANHPANALSSSTSSLGSSLNILAVSAQSNDDAEQPILLNDRIRLCVFSTVAIAPGAEVVMQLDTARWAAFPCACGDISDECIVANTVRKIERYHDRHNVASSPADASVPAHENAVDDTTSVYFKSLESREAERKQRIYDEQQRREQEAAALCVPNEAHQADLSMADGGHAAQHSSAENANANGPPSKRLRFDEDSALPKVTEPRGGKKAWMRAFSKSLEHEQAGGVTNPTADQKGNAQTDTSAASEQFTLNTASASASEPAPQVRKVSLREFMMQRGLSTASIASNLGPTITEVSEPLEKPDATNVAESRATVVEGVEEGEVTMEDLEDEILAEEAAATAAAAAAARDSAAAMDIDSPAHVAKKLAASTTTGEDKAFSSSRTDAVGSAVDSKSRLSASASSDMLSGSFASASTDTSSSSLRFLQQYQAIIEKRKETSVTPTADVVAQSSLPTGKTTLSNASTTAKSLLDSIFSNPEIDTPAPIKQDPIVPAARSDSVTEHTTVGVSLPLSTSHPLSPSKTAQSLQKLEMGHS